MAIPAGSRRWPLARRIALAACQPVPADSVAAFRVGFGLVAAASSARFLARGWVDALYLEPTNHLTYRWLSWVQPWPAPWMHLHMAGLGLLGLCIAVGYRTRLAAALFVAGFAWAEAIEATLYLNHYWFMTLTATLMVLLPVQHHWSLDAASGRVRASPMVESWVVWVLQAQLGVVYLFAGIAKLNPDWLWRAQPLNLWLADRAHLPIVGSLLTEPATAYVASWAGAVFDLTIVGWLLWPRTRRWAWAAVVVFHSVTGALFAIGVFPVVMILGTLIFFEPDWPRRLGRSVAPRLRRFESPPERTSSAPKVSGLATGLLACLVVAQFALPLRHYAMDGNVRWTEEGYYLSWRVMLTDKAGFVEYHVTDPSTGERQVVDPELVLTDWQAAMAATRPDLIHATALLVAEHYSEAGRPGMEVTADAWVSMNGSRRQRIVDPTINLAAYERGEVPGAWILPVDPVER